MSFPRFGDDAAALAAKIKVFQMVMKKYQISVVEAAFERYMQTGKEFPMPAHIVEIIEPPKQRLSAALYFQIKRRQAQGHYIYDERELEFLKQFEEQEYEKLDSHVRKNFEDEIAQEKQRYLENIGN